MNTTTQNAGAEKKISVEASKERRNMDADEWLKNAVSSVAQFFSAGVCHALIECFQTIANISVPLKQTHVHYYTRDNQLK